MREKFEKLPEIAEIIKEGVFWDGEIYRRTAICKLTHLYYVRGAWYAWQAKAQAVPEGFVLVSKERLAKAVDGIEALFKEDCTLALGELLPIQQDLNDMIEGLEYTITELSIDWGMECPICNHNEATCYSTATQESGYEFMDGDAVVCLKCGNKGEMDADGENSDIAWDEAQEQGHD